MKKVYLVLAIIVIALGVYAYFWYQNIQKIQLKAETAIEKASQYQILQSAIDSENQRCQEFISQKEGDFGSFEYCKTYIKWAEPLKLAN